MNNIEQKIQIVKENKEYFLVSLNAYLDKMYDMTDNYLDEDGNLKDFLEPDKKVENFIKELLEDEKEYEKVRKKLIEDDFSLSSFEINLIGISVAHTILSFNRYIEKLKEEAGKAKDFYEKILGDEIELPQENN